MNREFSELLASVEDYRVAGATESRALLHWFLFNVFRLDETQSSDSICDGPNDKGIHGAWVDDDTAEIFIFQSVYTNRDIKGLGDRDLREFVGSASWFADAANLKG